MTRILFYLICAVVPFITGIRIKEKECAFFLCFRLKMVLFFSRCFIQNWEEIESLKNEKRPGIVLEKSWNSVFPFLYEPCNVGILTFMSRIINSCSVELYGKSFITSG